MCARVCAWYLHSVGLLELAHLLDLVHQVSTVNVLHHKVQPVLGDDKQTTQYQSLSVQDIVH